MYLSGICAKLVSPVSFPRSLRTPLEFDTRIVVYIPSGNSLKNQRKICTLPQSDHMTIAIKCRFMFFFLLARNICSMTMLMFPVFQECRCCPTCSNITIQFIHKENTRILRINDLAFGYSSYFQNKAVIFPTLSCTSCPGKVINSLFFGLGISLPENIQIFCIDASCRFWCHQSNACIFIKIWPATGRAGFQFPIKKIRQGDSVWRNSEQSFQRIACTIDSIIWYIFSVRPESERWNPAFFVNLQ